MKQGSTQLPDCWRDVYRNRGRFPCWSQPSPKDRQTNPDVPTEASIEVLLHEVEISPELTLYLISNLDMDGLSAANLYQRRYDVEFDIRDLKVTLDTENIRAKSVEMFKKELYTSVIAYNLVAQFR